MELDKIYNIKCEELINKMNEDSIDVILTSPFYNTSRPSTSERSRKENESRYDIHIDNMSDEEYLEFTINLFKGFDKVLKKNGSVLYNLSYSSENTHLIWLTIAEIIKSTNFTTADTIIWKKKSALPNNTSSNKLTRIVEYVFVFCRKSELKTFNMNKKVSSVNSRGQSYYENVFNFIEAKNNDGSNKLNKATYSTELCEKLLSLYAKEGDLVFDPFMGTGTTANACINLGMNYIGSEISKAQCEFSEERLLKTKLDLIK